MIRDSLRLQPGAAGQAAAGIRRGPIPVPAAHAGIPSCLPASDGVRHYGAPRLITSICTRQALARQPMP